MSIALKTVCQYIADVRKKDGFYLTFNTVYNDLEAFHKMDEYDTDDLFVKYLNEKYTDDEKRDEFKNFMASNFPNVKLVEVFDMVDLSFLEWPYLGSILVDEDIGSEVFHAICEKFEKPNGDPIDNRLVIWTLKYKVAKETARQREESFESEW